MRRASLIPSRITPAAVTGGAFVIIPVVVFASEASEGTDVADSATADRMSTLNVFSLPVRPFSEPPPKNAPLFFFDRKGFASRRWQWKRRPR